MIKHIDRRLEWWASWWCKHIDCSSIGFPSMSVEGRMTEGCGSTGKSTTIVPDVMMSPEVAQVDRALKEAPPEFKAVAASRYIHRRRLGRDEFRELDRLHTWLDGFLAATA